MRTWIRPFMTKKMIKILTTIVVRRVDTGHRNSIIAIYIGVSFIFLFRMIRATIIIRIRTNIFTVSITLPIFIVGLKTIIGRLVLFIILITPINVYICNYITTAMALILLRFENRTGLLISI